jgi:Ca2+-binding RTX toxin-like protein
MHRLLRRARLELLESRQLLAIDLSEGILNVTGSNKSDRIDLIVAGEDLQVTVNRRESETFALADVTEINIAGLKGNDRITVDPAITLATTISGDEGNDRIIGGGGNDLITGGKGNDRCDGGAGDDELFGEGGNDRLHGGMGNDVLDGSYGNDWLLGAEGDDSLDGGEGVDHIYGGLGADVAFGGAKNDKMFGGAGDDELHGGEGNDIIVGNEDNDELFGDGGHDKLYGCAGDDTLHGGTGNDLLRGGDGNDLLDGGEGNDREFGGNEVDLDAELLALLSSPSGASGEARLGYEADEASGPELELQIEVVGGPAGATLEILIDGALIGSITLDSLGNGRLNFSSDIDDEGEAEIELPAGLEIHSGSIIQIGTDITGTFGPV